MYSELPGKCLRTLTHLRLPKFKNINPRSSLSFNRKKDTVPTNMSTSA